MGHIKFSRDERQKEEQEEKKAREEREREKSRNDGKNDKNSSEHSNSGGNDNNDYNSSSNKNSDHNSNNNNSNNNNNNSNNSNNNSNNNNNSNSNNNSSDNSNDKSQRKYDHSRTDSTPSSTIVTTIIVVTTETPTIYTGNVAPAQQQGSGETDPVTTDNNNKPSPSETAFVDKLIKGRDAYHRLVLALSIVGGIAGIALIAGAFIFTRMRSRKRKRKQTLDLEGAHDTLSSSDSSPKPPPPAHCRTSSIRSEDGEMTIIDFSQDPFQDPSHTLPYYKNNSSSQNGFNMSPSEPPLNSNTPQYNGRQNQTLSMLSQTTSATLPSAPTAKELDSPNYENPFEDQPADVISPIASMPSHESDISPRGVKNIPSSPSLLRPIQRVSLQNQAEFPPDLPPPPAYTPSAAPSAPPLYALPTNGRTLDPQHEEDHSRRHSISSFSMASSIRPISLRRGSGSHAYISSPFS
ncbi:hypothetical protein INT47_012773 [Mucor saturninus]|uniref:Uncharacterized protein n=1 Tax=Mucor saturninus TaxID=64648 RepID=A0A8H7QRB1_9FUNG|nr:hypothetical protein INT47_012773 [Mucor saturninus]